MNAGEWQLVPLKAVVGCNDQVLAETFSPVNEITYIEISDVDEYDGISWNDPIKFGDAASRARRIVRDGDVLVSTVRTYLRAVASVSGAPSNAIASTGFAVLRPNGINAGFLKYAVLNHQFLDQVIARSVGVSYPAINASELVAIKIALPARETQSRVARFLDRETAEIDAFIADQKELIALLTERRVATIAHAVTEGLDSSATTKDSGLEWLGRVPAEWQVTKVSRHFEVVLGKMLDSARERVMGAIDMPYVRAGNIQEGGLNLDSVNEMPFTPREAALWSLKKGDLLVVEGGAIPYTPEALKVRDENRADWLKRDPEIKCYLPGVPRANYMSLPFQIFQSDKAMIIAYEYAGAVRNVLFTDPGPAPIDSWMGQSVARWDDDTLVVTVTSQLDSSWLDRAGNHHSGEMVVVERWTPTSPTTMRYEATITDPQTFTRPWKMSMNLYKRVGEDARLQQFKCVEFVEELMYGHLRKEPLK